MLIIYFYLVPILPIPRVCVTVLPHHTVQYVESVTPTGTRNLNSKGGLVTTTKLSTSSENAPRGRGYYIQHTAFTPHTTHTPPHTPLSSSSSSSLRSASLCEGHERRGGTYFLPCLVYVRCHVVSLLVLVVLVVVGGWWLASRPGLFCPT